MQAASNAGTRCASIPPMIPFIVYGSLKTGQLVMGKGLHESIFNSGIHSVPAIWESMKQHLLEYIVGSMAFAVLMGILAGLITFIVLRMLGKKILVNLDEPSSL